MIDKINHKHILILLLCISFFLHFWNLDYPSEVVFDEVHFGKFVSGYYNGNYFFDIHPPLAKLIIASGGKLTGFRPGFGFENIGEQYQDSSYYGLRFFPAMIGSLLPLVMYFLIKVLGGSSISSLLGAFLTILENSLLVQSRFILLDSFLLFFGLAGMVFYLFGRKQKNSRKKIIYFIASGISLGASITVKWTGLVFLFCVFLFSFSSLIRHFSIKQKNTWKPILIFVLTLVIIPFIFYMSIFYIHFSLLQNSGTGDPFMSVPFQSTLKNSTYYNPSVDVDFLRKFVELNGVMLSANSGVTASHPYSITWYGMPVMYRSIYYWTKTESTSGLISRIYLIGNPFIWWAVLLTIIILAGKIVFKLAKRDWKFIKKKEPLIFLLAAYFVNLFTYMFISRAIFLYHYFPSLVLGIVIFCLLSENLFFKKGKPTKNFWAFLIISIFGFLFFSPLTFGFPLNDSTYKMLTWFPSWI